jgi:hypothetical protein
MDADQVYGSIVARRMTTPHAPDRSGETIYSASS